MENDDRVHSTNGKRKSDWFASKCCKFCGEIVECKTNVMGNHLESECEEYHCREGKRLKVLAQDVSEEGSRVLGEYTNFEEEEEKGSEVLTKMVVVNSLPLRIAEGEGFRHLFTLLGYWFKLPSQKETARNVLRLFMDEKKKLRSSLVGNSQRVCLTTNMWTSLQNTRHLCLTAHYIDSEWKLQKKVLGFRQVPDQKDVTIGKMIEDCLLDWGINKVFTITSDHASSKGETISYTKERLNIWNGCVLDGEFLHMKCFAQNINLVVSEALKDFQDCISNIRRAVKYVRSSSSRFQKFKECVQMEKIEYKGLVTLDVPTRWNTTYLMLKVSLKFQKAFQRLAEEDAQLMNYSMNDEDGKKRTGPPCSDDWDNAKVLVTCLMEFYGTSLWLNEPQRITSNTFICKILKIQSDLHHQSQSEDSQLGIVACSTMRKFDGYLGSINNTNKLLFISHVLDPRFKMKFLKPCLNIIHGSTVAAEMTKRVEDLMNRLFEYYSTQVPSETQTSNEKDKMMDKGSSLFSKSWMDMKLRMNDSFKNEVVAYLSEYTESRNDINKFDVLNWWKSNSFRFPVVSRMARDVLAVPISTMSFESAFNTEGHILDPLCTAMSTCCPKTFEALICTRSWLSSTPAPLVFPHYKTDDFAKYKDIESELSKNATHCRG